ncbi:MAG: phosphotransferase [Deltaproteobacteria bacterium]|jgi:phosphate uptake regulator|nr:phosphotransferase [Deltaproteobacteria bacterium]
MPQFEDIKDGIKLLTGEVLQAAREAQDILHKKDPYKSRGLYNRVAYITTQVALLQKETLDQVFSKTGPTKDSLFLQAMSSIASRLDRVADLLLNLDGQARYLSDVGFLNSYELDDFFLEIFHGLGLIHPAIQRRDVSLAVKLGQVEERLDALYADRFARLIKEFASPTNPENLVTTLMIIHYLERTGDMLLEIGEKIIYFIMGENIKLEQFKALGAGLKATGQNLEPGRLDFRSIWGGRSGCRIGVVGSQEGEQPVLFKHGPAFKLTMERENLERWALLRPGLTPEVKAFVPRRGGQEAALILEFIPSRTLQAFFLENTHLDALKGLKIAMETMISLWRSTKEDKPAKAEFSRQAESRLSEATTLYPNLMSQFGYLGQLKIPPLEKLLSQAKAFEATLEAPFTARVHGDFNLSNLLYNPTTGRLRLIDMYRSRESDYIQDISVMLVSIIRLPVFGFAKRWQLTQAALEAARLADQFAQEMNDATYEARLAFGLARSFVTSARFIMKEKLASLFVARARYLWEKLIDHGQKSLDWADFRFSREILDVPTDEGSTAKINPERRDNRVNESSNERA